MTFTRSKKQEARVKRLASAKMTIASSHKTLLTSVAFMALFVGTSHAQNVIDCDPVTCIADTQNASVETVDLATLMADDDDIDLEDLGISVAVDGEQVLGSKPITPAVAAQNEARATDVSLEHVDIQVKFDGLEVEPVLNVSTRDVRRSYQAGEDISFVATSNYPSWIERSEVLIYKAGKTNEKPIDQVEVDASGYANWQMPSTGDGAYEYVLRVYDQKGRFDETIPLGLKRTARDFEKHAVTPDVEVISAGEGEDRTAKRNIPVYGGAVTVYGRNVPNGYRVVALGETVSIDANSSFVIQRILPPGDHDVDVAVSGVKDGGLTFNRDINIPSNDWFYVGLVDATVGLKIDENDGEFDDVYTKGRLAFYVKGKIKGKYILTAAADTGEEEIQNLFRGLDAKNPRELLRRIDPNAYYPVYGDDSTTKDDAPTSGKFYVRLERGDSHVMWGNFKTNIRGAEFLRNERTLYGGSAVYKSQNTTSFGEQKIEAELYAAQPGTLPQRDVLRGTGGSAYFLKRQDLSIGSETISIEVRDPVTGRVLERKQLTYGTDYTIDYIQGVIILKQPLSSTAAGTGLVRDGALGSNEVSLIAQYEYVPTAGQVDGYSYGGRAQAWAADAVRFGVTGMKEETGNGTVDADQEMIGVDVKIRHSDTTFVEAEYAQTKGPGFGRTLSTDGGLTTDDEASAGASNRVASAWRVKAQLDLADVSDGAIDGKIGAYYENKENGFATLDYNIDVDQQIWGAYANLKLADKLTLGLVYDAYDDADNNTKAELAADAEYQINEYWKVAFGVKYSDLNTPLGVAKQNGSRTDVAGQITYAPDEDREFYVFGQGTVNRSGGREKNDRIGAGARVQVSEKVGVEGEVSYGTNGWGALAALTYDPTADEHYYLGYRLDSEREVTGSSLDGTDLGGIVVGANRRYDDQWSAFSENNYDMFGKRRSLTSTYGITYTPDAVWTIDGGLEIGRVIDPNATDIDRKAVSFGVSYREEDNFTARLRGELRFDDSQDDTRDLQSYLVSGGVSYKANPDWRLTANIDAVISQSDQGSILDGDYVEGAIGFAYRPVENDKINALFKYVFLYDLPGAEQVTANGSLLGPRQRSHVLSADATYQLNRYIDVGAKYGFRYGQAETTRGSEVYTNNNAHLGIIRADLHLINKWDALLEGRVLWSESASTTDYGALAAVYRHFGKNVKAGVGYNFGSFSDDLTDLTKDDHGLFFNVVGKF